MTGVDLSHLAQGTDLSREAIAMRQGRAGRLTGKELAEQAARVLEAANRAQRIAAKRRGGRREAAAQRRAADALLTAAVQIRLAERVPVDRKPLHVLSFQQVQTIEAEVRAAVCDDTREQWGALAVDTHRRVQAERLRARQEASP
jgi:hypothetical protein